MVGRHPVAAPAVTVTANRTEPGGCATVQWDDEGVVPEEFTLVKDGVLTDFHTMRESASWLKDYYGQQQRPVRSHGCAAAPTALHAPLTHPPNLALAPGARGAGLRGAGGHAEARDRAQELGHGISTSTWTSSA